MMNNILLSIAIPTVNRKAYLELTLNEFLPQIERNRHEVELVVSNNASEDNTDDYLIELTEKYPFIIYSKVDTRLTLFSSFSRAADMATGKFLILWGDDDIPFPYFVETMLRLIKEKPDIGLIHFNRLIGYNNGLEMRGLKTFRNNFEKTEFTYGDLLDFTRKHLYESTFMSTVVFRKEDWKRGLTYDTQKHYGFEFLGTVFYGMIDKKIIYISLPLCIQRKPMTRTWSSDWPLYGLIGIPNMVLDFERNGIYENGYEIWYKTYNTFLSYIYTLLCAAAYKNKYIALCGEINAHQRSFIRKFLCVFIIYFMPKQTYSIIRKVQFNFK